MTAIFQRWTPTKAEADLLVDMLTARLSQAKIAKALYIDVRTLKAFLARLDAAADAPAPEMPLPPPKPPRLVAPRVVAERLFAGEDGQ
jgi:hypothetical protein